jgi:hypothetical protein
MGSSTMPARVCWRRGQHRSNPQMPHHVVCLFHVSSLHFCGVTPSTTSTPLPPCPHLPDNHTGGASV